MPLAGTRKGTAAPGHVSATHQIMQGPDLRNILRQSYDNAKLTIDVSFRKHIGKDAGLFSGTIRSQNRLSVRTLACDISKRNLSTL